MFFFFARLGAFFLPNSFWNHLFFLFVDPGFAAPDGYLNNHCTHLVENTPVCVNGSWFVDVIYKFEKKRSCCPHAKT
jgi:hypothetical protein